MRKYLAESMGVFAIVFFGTGAVIVNQQSGGTITHAGISVIFGLVVFVMIITFGDISGAHFNPAVSVAFVVAKKFPLKELLPYIISQLIGALLASAVLKLMFPANEFLGATIPKGSELQSFMMELLLTFFLMLVILHVAHGASEKGLFAAIAIGCTILLEAMFAGPVSGASMNPARSFAPAIISHHLEHLWLYIVATIIGAILAVPVWKYLVNGQ
jgi:aquaporin Z